MPQLRNEHLNAKEESAPGQELHSQPELSFPRGQLQQEQEAVMPQQQFLPRPGPQHSQEGTLPQCFGSSCAHSKAPNCHEDPLRPFDKRRLGNEERDRDYGRDLRR
ncbi:hypothetical protein V5799_015679 [Amblyomma americanum]|uniref:Uncharacterized protein n=1 Tax=Amblyomma americanum TaxID=6943 RepID=A0AAQ4F7B8_AMBAM